MRFDLFVAFQEETIATGDRQPESMYLPSATGGSTTYLSAIDAWRIAAADDGGTIERSPLSSSEFRTDANLN